MKSSGRERRREKPASSKSSSRKYEEGLPLVNKKQILGFFLALFSILIILSVISYSDIDQSKLEGFNFREIFRKENQTANFNTANWLGIVGVVISGVLVRGAFGYFSAIIPGVIFLFGVALIRKRAVMDILQLSVYLLVMMILTSSLFGMLKQTLGPDKITYRLIGTSGEYFSSILYTMIGAFPGYLVLIILLILFGFMLLDRDVVKTLARMKLMFMGMKEKFAASFEEMKEKREEEKAKESGRSAIQLEREKILRSRLGKTKHEDDEEEHLIKDTKINRPSGNELIKEAKTKITADVDSEEKELEIEKVLPVTEGMQDAAIKPVKKIPVSEPSSEGESAGTEADENLPVEMLETYKQPGLDLLDEPVAAQDVISDEELKENGRLLQAKLLNFGVKIEKVIATPGPVVTLYELVPAEDVKLSRIESLEDDIALAMKAKGIRMIIPIPGKGTVGVEIPNQKAELVKIKSVIGSKKFNDSGFQLPIAFGKTISGEVYVDDLAKMPHLLIAGSTGSGKSVGINVILASLLYKMHPTDLKLLLIDPKKIELNLYSKLKYHYLAVSKDYDEKIVTTPQNAVLALKSLEIEMEKRYERLANATVRNIFDYNKKFAEGKLKEDENIKHGKMPYIVVVIDELADLMITAAREVEEPIARLAQLARAVGIHLILATQRPSVDVITGVIKANFSARIAYLVNSKIDSRTILDMNGADQLLGNGDMLYLPPGVGKPMRIQSPYITSDEVEKLTDYIKSQKGFTRPFDLPSISSGKKKSYSESDERDELFEEAARVIVRYQQGSVSLLQRKLKIGYARAARIVDELETAGVVGPFDGSKARDVLVDSEAQLDQLI